MTAIPTEPGQCPLCGPGQGAYQIAAGIDFEYMTVPEEFTVVACARCGTQFLDPRPSDVAIQLLYPPDYEPYLFSTMPRPIRAARDLVQSSKVRLISNLVDADATVVDIGCGVGSLLRLLRRSGSSRWRLIGWDFPGDHLDRLAADGFEVISAPIGSSHAPTAVADVVVLNQVIEHFGRPDELLAVVKKILRPGGAVVIETPDTDGLDAHWFRRRYWGGYHFPRHLVLFDSSNLRVFVERSGFEVVATERLVSPAFWNQSMHHLLVDRARTRPLASFFSIRNPISLAIATMMDLVLRRFRPTSNQRLVARLR